MTSQMKEATDCGTGMATEKAWLGERDSLSMVLMMVLVWGPILLLGFFLVRAALSPRHDDDRRGDPAEEEARRVYARGEIELAQLHQVMRGLRDHPVQPRLFSPGRS